MATLGALGFVVAAAVGGGQAVVRQLAVPGGQVSYDVSGPEDGRGVVCLSGLGDTGGQWRGGWQWRGSRDSARGGTRAAASGWLYVSGRTRASGARRREGSRAPRRSARRLGARCRST